MKDRIGQQVVLAEDFNYSAKQPYTWYWAWTPGQTIRSICAKLGHPDMALAVAKRNKIRSVTQPLKVGTGIWMPRALVKGVQVVTHFSDGRRAQIKDGYAIFQATDRPGREGIATFKGYNPLAMDLPVTFEGWLDRNTQAQSGWYIEQAIMQLERMAGRGPYGARGGGPPSVVRVSCTDNQGNIVSLVPWGFQYSIANQTTMRWRINGIDWDDNALSDAWGRRVRASAVIHLWAYTSLTLAGKTA